MKEVNHSKSYTSADIARYLNREMPAAEMHAMEKAALDDPFLADAIEGFAEVGSGGQSAIFHQDLHELKTRLNERTKEKRNIVFFQRKTWLRVAAAVLLIAGSAGVIYTIVNLAETKRQLAKNEEVSSVAADSTSITGASGALNDDSFAGEHNAAAAPESITLNENKSRENQLSRQDAPSATLKHEDADNKQETAAEPQVNERSKEAAIQSETAGEAAALEINERKPTANRSLAKTSPANTRSVTDNNAAPVPPAANSFNGKVVDVQNQPIAGASVMVENKNVGVTTDQQGNFNLLIPDSTLKVSVASAGFEIANATLKANLTGNRIVLTPSPGALDEVVVSGYSKPKRNTQISGSVKKTAGEPATGPAAFMEYVKKNKRVPVPDSAIHGEVVISFSVNKKGKATDLKIEQSLSTALDAEAKRLLMEGPSWTPTKGKNRETIVIRF